MSKWICLGFVVCASVAGNGFAASGGSDGSDAAAAGTEVCGKLSGYTYTLADARQVFGSDTTCEEAATKLAQEGMDFTSATFGET